MKGGRFGDGVREELQESLNKAILFYILNWLRIESVFDMAFRFLCTYQYMCVERIWSSHYFMSSTEAYMLDRYGIL